MIFGLQLQAFGQRTGEKTRRFNLLHALQPAFGFFHRQAQTEGHCLQIFAQPAAWLQRFQEDVSDHAVAGFREQHVKLSRHMCIEREVMFRDPGQHIALICPCPARAAADATHRALLVGAGTGFHVHKRIVFSFTLNNRVQINVAVLQEANCFLQLRSHDNRLTLTKVLYC